ncbi:L-threonylcarbamoyladenylate synthase [Caedibacter taeniospiralis]|jgi:L-threonylcarbamoyladenylate synthase|uniref:L-threonylcarbamoyladenylate synthase n=1 Tax=Caedibacter taeniospiralis TaxID=28907 RepID=UPI0037C051D8
MKINKNDIDIMVSLLKENKVLALPTESVYGLSSVLEPKAVQKIMILKKRSHNKGFIVLSGEIEHLLSVIDTSLLNDMQIARLKKKYNRATTWIVPVKPEFRWLTGQFDSIAVRLTSHPLLSELTLKLGRPIISTSANISDMPAATSAAEVKKYFADSIDYIYMQSDFVAAKPSRLINLLTEEVLRD